MGHYDEQHLPDELQDVARRLRAERPEASALELDRIKTRTMARARASRPKGSVLRHRLIVAMCAIGLMASGTGGVIAASNNSSNSNAANSEYSPGKGCGVTPPPIKTGAPGQDGKKNEDKPCPPTAGPK